MRIREIFAAFTLAVFFVFANADDSLSLDKSDFVSASRFTVIGGTLVRAKLSESGKAKFKKLNESSVGQNVAISVSQVTSRFRLREPIRGDQLEMGPYSLEDAKLVEEGINNR